MVKVILRLGYSTGLVPIIMSNGMSLTPRNQIARILP